MKFILLVWNVGGGSGIAEFLGEAKVNYVNHMGGFTGAHDKIGWFDITVDDRVSVDELDA
jgi:tagatose-1,6-bisphosphate aldolase non-catalytic subunit AgaZ/GatZ